MASLQQRAFSVLVMAMALSAVAARNDPSGSIRIRNELDVDLNVRCWDKAIAELKYFTIPVNGVGGFRFNADAEEYWHCVLDTKWVSNERPGVFGDCMLYARSPTFNPGRHSSWLANYDGVYRVRDANKPGLSPGDGQLIYHWAP